jgi:predicted small integral membrane protein
VAARLVCQIAEIDVLAIRLLKTAMAASAALFALLVTLNNLVDYGSNYEFVRHTLSMDTTFPGNALKGRAITSPALWTAAYWAIILTEAAVGIMLALGAIRLAMALRADARIFNAAKTLALVGVGLGFLLWFTGFMAVGGEWFAMWQSKIWNGQEPAFRFYMTLLAVGIFINQPDGEFSR